jgi:hypothetical protein
MNNCTISVMATQDEWEVWFAANIDLEHENATKAKNRILHLEAIREKYRQAVLDGDEDLVRTLLTDISGQRPQPNTTTQHNVGRKDAASLLSSSGAALLAIAALVFTAVAWGSLGVIGQAAVLIGSTVAAVFGARHLVQRKRPATAESLSWLAGAFGAIDILAISRLGLVQGIPTHLLLAAAAAGASLLAATTSRVAGHQLRGPKQLIPISLSLTTVFATLELDSSLRAFLLSLAAFVGVRAVKGPFKAQWVRSAAGLAAAAALSSLLADTGSTHLIFGIAAGLLLVGRSEHLNLTNLRISLTAASLVEFAGWSTLILTSAKETSTWSGTTPALLPLSVFVVLGMISSRWQSGNASALCIPLVGAFIGVHLVGTSVLSRFLIVSTVVFTALLWRKRGQLAAQTVLAATLPYLGGLIIVQIGGSTTTAFILTTAYAIAGVQLGIRKKLHDVQLQAVTAAAAVVALVTVFLSAGEPSRMAGVLGVLAAGSAVLALQHRGRGIAVVVSALAAAGCYWSLLPGGRVVELATLPVSIVWCIVGIVALRRTTLRSFILLGPGLLLASVPSVIAMIVNGETLVRTLLLLMVATLVAVIGARQRLLAPIIIGVSTAVASAFTQIGPWATGMPRWITLGSAGVALLLAGARFETLRERLNSSKAKLISLR